MRDLSLLVVICRGLAFGGGAILIWAALFLKVDEEATVQRRLEMWRDRAGNALERARGRRLTGVRAAAAIVDAAITALFGPRIRSKRGFWIVVNLTFLSASIGAIGWLVPRHAANFTSTLCAAICFAISIALRTQATQRWLAHLLTVLGLVWHAQQSSVALVAVLSMYMVLFGVPANLLLFAMIRWTVQYLRIESSAVRMVALLVSTIILTALPLIAVLLPAMTGSGPEASTSRDDATRFAEAFGNAIGDALILGMMWGMAVLVACSTLAAVAASVSVILVSIVFAIDVAFWFFLERPLYAAARHGLLQHKRVLLAIGFALLIVAVPAFGRIAKGLSEILLK